MDDAALVRIYARENATQRGTIGTAQAIERRPLLLS